MKSASIKLTALCAVAALSAAAALPAQAITFTASELIGGYTYAASASFTYDSVNNWLDIVLTNTAANPVDTQGKGLSGLYFNAVGGLMTKNSASVGVGSTIVNDAGLNDSLIGREYAFRNNIGAAEASFTDAVYGISSTGLGIFGAGERFDTSGNLAGPGNGAPAGDDFNIVPTSQVTFTGGGLDGTPFVQNAMHFRLNTPVGFVFSDSTITDVAFHYGSGQEFPTIFPTETGTPPQGNDVPEPGTLAMLVGGGIAFLSVLRKRRNN